MAAGDSHTAIIRSGGALWVAGYNYYGQLGDSSSADRMDPYNTANDVAAVFAGPDSTFWIKSDRTLWATGEGSYGALGDGGNGNRYVPAQIATAVATAASGGGHVAFVKQDGTLWTSGANGYGQLGSGNSNSRSNPAQIATGVTDVAAGSGFTLFLKSDGTLWGTGSNYDGQLGDGTQYTRTSPGQISTNVTAIAAGAESSYFIRGDGSLWAMGDNYYGQLGDGTTSSRFAPVLIATGVKSVKAGARHALFLKTDDTLWAMGRNNEYQLGDGTNNPRYVPAQVASSVTEFTAGGNHTIYRKSDQTYWCSGYNWEGDFGLGFESSSVSICPMNGAPVLSSVPTGKIVDPGTYVTFAVTANGPGPITYQWRKDNQPISGAKSASYSFSAYESNQGDYTVDVTGRDGTVTTVPASLVVNDQASIDVHPSPVAAMPGQPAVFSVQAKGTGALTYQWRKSSTNIPGATSATFTIPSVTAADAGSYSCVATNSIGSATSNSVALTVGPAITGQPQNKVGNAGASHQFSVTATGSSPTYQWRRGQTPISGATSSTYTITLSKALEGTYDVVISNAAGSVTSNSVTLLVNEAVTFTAQPRGATLQPGAPLLLEVAVGGTGPFTYQWRKGGISIPNATDPTLNIASVSVADEGLYTCAVTNVVGTQVSSSAEVRIGPSIVVPPVGGTVNPGARVSFSVQVSGSGTFTYSWRKDGVTIANGPTFVIDGVTEDDEGAYSVQVSTAYGTVQSGPAQLWVNDVPKIKTQPQSVQVKPGSAASFSVEMQGAGNFTYQWRHNGSEISGATHPFCTIEAADDASIGSYDVVVTGATGSVTSAAASLELDLRPTITRSPMSRAARLGATLTLDVEATGEGSLTYQWYRNGAVIAGATSSSHQLSDIQPASEGSYAVQVGNAAGFVMSAPALITLAEWTEVAGIYQALFLAEDSANAANPWPGRVTITVTSRGSFSGRLEFEGLARPLRGTFGKDLRFSTIIPRIGGASLQLLLRLSPGEEESRLDAEIGPEGLTPAARLSATRSTLHKSLNPALQAGRYVMVMEKTSESDTGPRAPGYALIRVSSAGAVSLTGKMPDGAKLTSGGYIAEDGAYPFYQGLYRQTATTAGALAGPVFFAAIPSDQAVAGNLWWHKPAQSSGAYATAFSFAMGARGAFLEPTAGESWLEVPQSSAGLSFASETAEGQPLFDATVALSARNVFTVPAKTQKLTLQLDARAGLIRGSFTEPGTGTRRRLEGVILPGVEALGFFPASTAAGSWSIQAN